MDDSRNQIQSLCRLLNVRRQRLRMSYSALAKRSGVSMPTVVRTVTGQNPNASLAGVAAIATALGMRLKLQSEVTVADLVEAQARQKAGRLVGLVQGTLALEAQALDTSELGDVKRHTVHKLLSGSRRKLWDE